MNEILHANIFFVIASIATICFSILICYVIFQVIKIVQLVRSILEKIEAGSEVLATDLAHIRMFFSEGSFLTRILGFFGGGMRKSARRKKEEEL
ncbi:MAG TPA: hypothetical protein PKD95_02110 [Candidatus Paceibacterota bacterium]|nr:hypothetical protein [Candidatus Paceibacterota bacterium]